MAESCNSGVGTETETCEMCGEVMTKCDHDYCDICPTCLDGE